MTKNWYSDWFDSHYYHVLYKDRNEKEAEFFIDNIISHLQIQKKSKLLDVACGKGRHAIYFNKKGLHVVGIDLSSNSINIAKKHESKTLQFKVHDMRKEFKKNEFDIVTNLFTSFGYFDDEKEEQDTINSMAKNLKKGGILIIDFMNVKKTMLNLITSEKKTVNAINFKIYRKIKNNQIIKDIKFSDNNIKYHFEEKVKALTLDDINLFIINAGLKIVNIFGNYKLEDFNALNSDRLIIVCKK